MKKLIAIIISALVLCSMLSLAATAFAAHGSEPDTATETETETKAENRTHIHQTETIEYFSRNYETFLKMNHLLGYQLELNQF